MKRMLLSSSMRPFGTRHGDAFSCTANGAFQLTWAQGAFRLEDTMWHWGLDLIAANISIPTVVLHFPSLSAFIREIKKKYDYIGLSFNLCTFHKLKKQVLLIRKYSPESTIILGGYGTILPDEVIGEWGDVVCREEGVAFMQRFLGEPERPLVHPLLAVNRKFFGVSSGEKTGIIFSSMGCPNGCDFCITSHYYKRTQVRFLPNGHDVYRMMMTIQDRESAFTSFTIIDEDFLVDEKRGREFLESAREYGRFFDIMIFSSIRSLSRFTAREIAEMGITRVWCGFEAEAAGYGKQTGREFGELVTDLASWGITATVSMIIGYDYQNEERINLELQRIIAARPTATQVMILSPCYGTPAWNRLEKEKRILEHMRDQYAFHDGYTLLFSHPFIESGRMNVLVKELYKTEYRALGPSMFRFLRILFDACERLAASNSKLLQKRAEELIQRFSRARMIIPLGILFGPTRQIRTQVKKLYSDINSLCGNPPVMIRCLSLIAIVFYFLTRIRFEFNIFTQPPSSRKEYGNRIFEKQ